MLITEVNAIIEVACHANGGEKDTVRLFRALSAIKESMLTDSFDGDYPIVAVHHDKNETPVDVPGFGHNYLCTPNCKCDLQPYGVLRYFGVTFWVVGAPSFEILKDYQLTDHARLIVCGYGEAYEPGNKELN